MITVKANLKTKETKLQTDSKLIKNIKNEIVG